MSLGSPVTGIEWPVVPNYRQACLMALRRFFDEIQAWPNDRLTAHQLSQAGLLLLHHTQASPFTRKRLKRYKLSRDGQITLKEFRNLPLISIADIELAGDALFSTEIPNEHGNRIGWPFPDRSGGEHSIRYTEVGPLIRRALWQRNCSRYGLDPNLRFVVAMPAGKDGLNLSLDVGIETEEKFFMGGIFPRPGSRKDLSNPRIDTAHTLKGAPALVVGHTSDLINLAEATDGAGIQRENVRSIFVLDGALDPTRRSIIEKYWGAPVYLVPYIPFFGCIAMACAKYGRHHIHAENFLLEILDEEGQPAPLGNFGRLVITDLQNFAMPLIRYDTGEKAALDVGCECGLGLPVIRLADKNLQC
ncbi:MAG: hypothetical protein HOJ95_00755 [Nitrospinaceae bacterium]|jgi:phenylacetate-CoA ligase|nr:hypothetical protein [Nitrospinaceae bacterium]